MTFDFYCEECGGPGYGYNDTICSACASGYNPFPTCTACDNKFSLVRNGHFSYRCHKGGCGGILCGYCHDKKKICLKCKGDYLCPGCERPMRGSDPTAYCGPCELKYESD